MVRFCAGPCAARLDLDGGRLAPATTGHWRCHCAILLKQLLPSLVVTFPRTTAITPTTTLHLPIHSLFFAPSAHPATSRHVQPLSKYRFDLYQRSAYRSGNSYHKIKRRTSSRFSPTFCLILTSPTTRKSYRIPPGGCVTISFRHHPSAQTLIINSNVSINSNNISSQSRSNCKAIIVIFVSRVLMLEA